MANINPIQDDNQNFSLFAATGTAGTAEAIRLVADSSGNLGVNIVSGEIVASLGTVNVVEAGSVVVTAGTTKVTAGSIVVTAGTISTLNTIGTVGVVNDGTVAIKGTVPVSGALTIGTIAEITNIAGGTVTTTMGDLSGGTIDSIVSGTIAEVTKVSNVADGTIAKVTSIANLAAGTVTSVGTVVGAGVVGTVTGVGVVGNLVTGTIAAVTSVTNVASGTLAAITSVTNLASGTLAAVTSVTNLAAGTVSVLNAGSVVVTNGTVSLKNNPVTQVLTVSALATAGGSAFGTLSAASGAGTTHVVSGLQVVVSSGTVDCYLGFGTGLTGGSVLARGNFVPGGGIVRDFNFPIQSGTNSEICWELAGAGTAYFAVNYWKS